MNDSLNKDNFKDEISLKKGSVLFHEGEASSFMYIISKGKVGILKETQGRVIPLAAVREKNFIGEMSLFNDEVRSASAIALEDTTVYMVKKSDIRKVLKNCPDWVTNIMITLTDRLRDVDELMREHRITENELSNDFELHPDEQKEVISALEDYKKRRGI
jgi:CRP-like cAMP-binding protein